MIKQINLQWLGVRKIIQIEYRDCVSVGNVHESCGGVQDVRLALELICLEFGRVSGLEREKEKVQRHKREN